MLHASEVIDRARQAGLYKKEDKYGELANFSEKWKLVEGLNRALDSIEELKKRVEFYRQQAIDCLDDLERINTHNPFEATIIEYGIVSPLSSNQEKA
jgi:hypothetical protein